ncbi:kinase-like domain-containing protein [Mycena rosella]|uniref:Kinase-like domain-containing protein n=1 Tax=Mycena rosella TaxID=1033263 RepID=A0AAD7DXP9_MYCRO|nr:kinase-like domain-containing protein [Mycena rosella]
MSPSASYVLPDLTGDFIDGGSLELICLLGSGAYGKVYKALDTMSSPDALVHYAVKCMPRYEPDSREAKMQENELMLHRMVSAHPRVITFRRQFSTDEYVFVVLDFCAGGDFFEALVEAQVYRGNPALIKQAFGELLDAVEFCHRNSVYHRDLKPENILCNSAGTDIRLADFGLATQIAVSRQFGCGSRFYMSPESIDRAYTTIGCYSARHSDLWALSIIFTNMIAGRHAWLSADLSDSGFARFQSDPSYLLNALKITQPANALLQRCFHANPLRRPTLSEFRTAVNELGPEDMVPIETSLTPCSPLPNFPMTPTTSLDWTVAVAAPASVVGELDTPRPQFGFDAPMPMPKLPIHAPQPIRLSPFVFDSSFSSSSSSSIYFASIPPPASSPSSSSSSLPSSDSSAPSVSSASDSSPPATPATFPVDDVCIALAAHKGFGTLPAVPPRAYLASRAGLSPCTPNEYRTVADNGRPTLPTRRKFWAACFAGGASISKKIENREIKMKKIENREIQKNIRIKA